MSAPGQAPVNPPRAASLPLNPRKQDKTTT